MDKQHHELKELLSGRMEVTFEIEDLTAKRRHIEDSIVERVIEARMFDCITVNFRRLDRVLNQR